MPPEADAESTVLLTFADMPDAVTVAVIGCAVTLAEMLMQSPLLCL
jgi:hypothetical protein